MKYFLVFLLLMPLMARAQDSYQEQAIEPVLAEQPAADDAYSPYTQGIPEIPQEELLEQLPQVEDAPVAEEPPAPEPEAEPIEPEKIEGKKASLQILDKINARVAEVEVELDKEMTYHELKINVKRCVHSPKDSKEENIAFMRIWDIGQGDYTNIVFSGWMFSSNPALHSFEHPIYDVVLLKCLDDEPAKKEPAKK
jgi:hypothetical protein